MHNLRQGIGCLYERIVHKLFILLYSQFICAIWDKALVAYKEELFIDYLYSQFICIPLGQGIRCL